MKYLGIDYGTKRIGLAVSDDGGSMAFPRGILPGGKSATTTILEFIQKERIEAVVIGASFAQDGTDNAIMDRVRALANELAATGITVEYQKESFSSHEARLSEFAMGGKGNQARPRQRQVADHIDDRAAALILQRYLDRVHS